MIKPTVGRVVYYTPGYGENIAWDGSSPLAAIVTCVWSDTCVNLGIFDANGVTASRTSVPLIQGDAPKPSGYFCEWMPYQLQQAAKQADPEETLA